MAKNDQALPTLEKKTWDDFRNSGLLRFVNMFLHIFGWTIVLNIGKKSVTAYPARCNYDGFSEQDENAFRKLGAALEDDKFFKSNMKRRKKDFTKVAKSVK